MIMPVENKDTQLSVLVVTQNQDEFALITKWMQPYNIKTESTEKPINAVSMVQKHHYSLVLIDMDLSGEMGGFETIWLLSSYTKGENIILMSSDITSTSATKAQGYGIDQWLLKPLNRLNTLEAIETALDDIFCAENNFWSFSKHYVGRMLHRFNKEVFRKA